jgi:hypothetical protein
VLVEQFQDVVNDRDLRFDKQVRPRDSRRGILAGNSVIISIVGTVPSSVDWSKRVSVLRHALPKLKSLPIYTDSVDDAAVHIRLEMATRHLSINCLNTENNHSFEFTPLCV